MTWIKICGITNLEDAQTAVDAGADALGFVFYEKSPRKVDPETARQIVAQLPSNIEKIGVFVLDDAELASRIAGQAGLTTLQIHVRSHSGEPSQGDGLVAHCVPRTRKYYLALPASWFVGDDAVKGNLTSLIERRPDRPFDTILLDSGTSEQPGGTGKTFDWVRAAPLFERMMEGLKVIVAGGLNPGNVADAIRILKPWGVDVSSGVEAQPGKKDPEKLRAFISAVRKADEVA